MIPAAKAVAPIVIELSPDPPERLKISTLLTFTSNESVAVTLDALKRIVSLPSPPLIVEFAIALTAVPCKISLPEPAVMVSPPVALAVTVTTPVDKVASSSCPPAKVPKLVAVAPARVITPPVKLLTSTLFSALPDEVIANVSKPLSIVKAERPVTPLSVKLAVSVAPSKTFAAAVTVKPRPVFCNV